jgi:glycyl-tRNA synthetase beta chain
MSDFLFEIGLEEVPARMIAGAEAELLKRVTGLLERERLVPVGVAAKSFSTPRRLAVLVPGVAEQQEDLAEETMGPSAKIAYKDGVATPAAEAFARKAGVAVGDLKTVTTAKGEYLAATVVKAGKTAAQVIQQEMPKELAGIHWAKNMYWRAGKPERFVRPVRWMVAMLGTEGLLMGFAGFVSNDVTYGHRVLHGSEQIELDAPGEYEATLLKAYVMVDVEARRHRIRKELDRVCRSVDGMRWREDHALVDKMTHLTEWPSAMLGSFDAVYLDLPEEVLVTVMRDHQNYFAVEDKAGRLAPYFLAVLNTEADEAGQAVIRHGNERVLRARFNDARFFWEFDQRTPLSGRVALLENVTFQKELGSYRAKTERVRRLAAELAEIAGGVDVAALDEACLLAKTDLTAELVKEFTELQGVVGGLYARAQGFSEAAATAIYDQYKPVSMEDSVPRTAEGSLLAIADKADTIAGMFGLGLEPTGSKDPFALRRAANGIVKILAESPVALTLGEICFLAAAGNEQVVLTMELFFAERLEFYLREVKGQAYDVVKAVLEAGSNDVSDAVARAEAVSAVRGSEDFTAVCSAFKRMKNILSQAREKGLFEIRVESPAEVKMHPAQNALTEAALAIAEDYKRFSEKHEYVAALQLIATLRPTIDTFFEQVMVMDEDPSIRRSRLGLLHDLVDTFSKIADFSEIVVAG